MAAVSLDMLMELLLRMQGDLRDIKHRLSSIEVSLAHGLGLDAAKSERIDRLEVRLERVERRLELREDE
jgi:hypothetical protein